MSPMTVGIWIVFLIRDHNSGGSVLADAFGATVAFIGSMLAALGAFLTLNNPDRVLVLRRIIVAVLEKDFDFSSLSGAAGLGIAKGFASFAGLLVSKRHPHLREAWLGDLRREQGEQLHATARRALRASIGYLAAAVRIRLQDTLMARSLYRLLNYVLSSRSRTRVAINLILGAVAIRLLVDQGFDVSFADVVAFPIMWQALDKGATWLRKRLFPDLIVDDGETKTPTPQ